MNSPIPTTNPTVVAPDAIAVVPPPAAPASAPTSDCFSKASPFSRLASDTFQPPTRFDLSEAPALSAMDTARYPDHEGDCQ